MDKKHLKLNSIWMYIIHNTPSCTMSMCGFLTIAHEIFDDNFFLIFCERLHVQFVLSNFNKTGITDLVFPLKTLKLAYFIHGLYRVKLIFSLILKKLLTIELVKIQWDISIKNIGSHVFFSWKNKTKQKTQFVLSNSSINSCSWF